MSKKDCKSVLRDLAFRKAFCVPHSGMQSTSKKNSNEEPHYLEKVGVSSGKPRCIYYDAGLMIVLMSEKLVHRMVLKRLV